MGTLEGHADGVNAVALTMDGRRAVSASDDMTLKVWDLENGSIICSFNGESYMLSCAISPDGRTIVAGEASGRLHFLRLEGLPAGEDDKYQNTSEYVDYSIASKRLNDKNDAVLSESEMKEHLSSSD